MTRPSPSSSDPYDRPASGPGPAHRILFGVLGLSACAISLICWIGFWVLIWTIFTGESAYNPGLLNLLSLASLVLLVLGLIFSFLQIAQRRGSAVLGYVSLGANGLLLLARVVLILLAHLRTPPLG